MPRSVSFYRDTLKLSQHLDTPRMAGFSLGDTNLLIFARGQTGNDIDMGSRGIIPKHGLDESPADLKSDKESLKLRTHFCLAVDTPSDTDRWARELKDRGVDILGEAEWPAGSRSVYFSDPDGHVAEIASRGIWPNW